MSCSHALRWSIPSYHILLWEPFSNRRGWEQELTLLLNPTNLLLYISSKFTWNWIVQFSTHLSVPAWKKTVGTFNIPPGCILSQVCYVTGTFPVVCITIHNRGPKNPSLQNKGCLFPACNNCSLLFLSVFIHRFLKHFLASYCFSVTSQHPRV